MSEEERKKMLAESRVKKMLEENRRNLVEHRTRRRERRLRERPEEAWREVEEAWKRWKNISGEEEETINVMKIGEGYHLDANQFRVEQVELTPECRKKVEIAEKRGEDIKAGLSCFADPEALSYEIEDMTRDMINDLNEMYYAGEDESDEYKYLEFNEDRLSELGLKLDNMIEQEWRKKQKKVIV